MNIFQKLVVIGLISGLTACSSVSDSSNPVTETVAPEQELSVDSFTDIERQALATTVFYFGFDSSDLSQEDRSILVYHANKLKSTPDTTIRLEGHASEEGTREYNLALGERRAKEIAMFLVVNGVATSQIEVVSYGEEQPAVVGSTEEDRAKNRRVEIK